MLHYAIDLADLKKEFKKKVMIDGKPIMLLYLADKVYALHDKCTHMGASLSKGSIEGEAVKCRIHGAKFDVKTGEVVEKAHVGFIKMPTKKTVTFKTEIKEDKVFVEV